MDESVNNDWGRASHREIFTPYEVAVMVHKAELGREGVFLGRRVLHVCTVELGGTLLSIFTDSNKIA